MQILRFELGELQTNCYFVIQNSECVIIDPGDSAEFLLEEISRRNLKPQAIISTHGHFDHTLAVGELQAALQIPFYIFKEDEFLLKRVDQTAKYFLQHVPVTLPIQSPKYLTEGMMTFGSIEFDVKKIPGHTPGSCCLYIKADDQMNTEDILFTGDTLFNNGIGRYDFAYSDKKELYKSLDSLFKTFPEHTIVYPGHGDSTILEEEVKNVEAIRTKVYL